MMNLLYKELVLFNRKIALAGIFALFIAFMGCEIPEASGVFYVVAMYFIVYFFLLYSTSYDNKNKSETLLIALPIKREMMVYEKYVMVILGCTISWLIILLFTVAIKLTSLKLNGRIANFYDLAAAMTVLALFYSVYFPVYFKFGGAKLRIFNSIVYILVAVSPSFITKFLKGHSSLVMKISEANISVIIITAFMVAACVYILSALLSKKIYINREF